jgi:hypothetical protein
MTFSLATTPDAYIGLDNPSQSEWERWHRAMLEERASRNAEAYADREASWSDATFRQVFLFMYDASFFDPDVGRYRTPELIERLTTMFGRVDSVLLWHAYPRLGFDSRTQFDFYRDMPGGLSKLRSDVVDVLHARGIRVFVDYNPWDAGTYDELAEIVLGLDADGVMLDTMTEAPEELIGAVRQKKRGVVFAPELRLRDADLARFRQSWAQWFDVGDKSAPSVLRHRWLVPQHRQLTIRRWDTTRREDIIYSFCNGAGLILWDNVFGTWNPYSREDRRLIAETAAVFDRYERLFVRGEWRPLIPTGTSGLDASSWTDASTGKAIFTLRNRTGERLHFRVPDAPRDLVHVAFWGDRRTLRAGDLVAVEAEGVQAVAFDDPASAHESAVHFDRLSARADVDMPGYDERAPRPRHLRVVVLI